MSEEIIDPLADDSDRMRSGKVSIADRPIEAGVYSWGWVGYRGYDLAGRPSEISVVMFNEPTNKRDMASKRRILTQPRWRSMLSLYGPIAVGLLTVMSKGTEPWIWQFILLIVAISFWQLHKQSQAIKSADASVTIWANRNIENYTVGKAFLRALTHRDLPKGDIFAYFNLRSHAQDLKILT